MSRIVRAVNGSSSALPARPRLTRSTPASRAARAGQVVLGLSAEEPWLIELPWCSQTRPVAGIGSTGASVRSSTSRTVSLHGSHSSTTLSRAGSPTKRAVPAGPCRVSTAPDDMSTSMTSPLGWVAWATRSPSTSRS